MMFLHAACTHTHSTRTHSSPVAICFHARTHARKMTADNVNMESFAVMQKPELPVSSSSSQATAATTIVLPGLPPASIDPWQARVAREMLADFPLPVMRVRGGEHMRIDANEMYEQLRSEQLHLPCMTASHESQLLRESGQFQYKDRQVSYPACVLDTRCVGHTITLSGQVRKCTFIALMFESEWDDLLHRGRQPVSRRPCILCYRRWHTQLLVRSRHLHIKEQQSWPREDSSSSPTDTMPKLEKDAPLTSSSSSSVPRVRLAERPILQSYYNLVDEQEGYLYPYMLLPQNGEILMQPVCGLNLDVLRMRMDTSQNRQYVDQTAIVYTSRITHAPNIGERVKDF